MKIGNQNKLRLGKIRGIFIWFWPVKLTVKIQEEKKPHLGETRCGFRAKIPPLTL